MDINIQTINGAVPIAIMETHGELDASNYLELVQKAQGIYQTGIRYILLDLSDTPFLSSSGLVALHSLALLMRGEQPVDPSMGWGAFRAMDRDLSSGPQKHVKLLNPQPRVDRTLEHSGFKEYFEIYTDRDAAIASFQAESTQLPAA